MESDQTFIQKTFQMINQLTGNVSFIPVKVLYLTDTREINISRAITDINNNGTFLSKPTGCNLNNCLVFYLDNTRRLFVHIGTFPFGKNFQLLLKFELFLKTTIKIRYRKLSDPNSPKSQKITPAPCTQKKRTRKQKTIQQVRDLVTNWRNIFQMTDNNGKKLYNLQSAAQKLCMQKKTLDDYYYKIKNAQAYGFDFQKNKNEKIGFLRKFVKDSAKNKKDKITSFPQGGINSQYESNASNNFNFGATSYASNYPFLPQKPPQDQIDKYFADDVQQSSSSEDSEKSY